MQVVYVVLIVAKDESWRDTLNLFCLYETFLQGPLDWALVSQCWLLAKVRLSWISFMLTWKAHWWKLVDFFVLDSVKDAVIWAFVAVIHNLNTRSETLLQYLIVFHCLRDLVYGIIF